MHTHIMLWTYTNKKKTQVSLLNIILICVLRVDHLLVNLAGVRLHLLDDRHQLVEEPLAGVQSQEVLLLEQEAQAVALRPAQAVARRRRHGGDGVLDVDRGGQFA